MPELPEVEIIAQELRRRLTGGTIRCAYYGEKRLRKPFSERLLTDLPNKRVESVTRHGKSLRINLDAGLHIFVHLGMSGKVKIAQTAQCDESLYPSLFSSREKHEHFSFIYSDKEGELQRLSYVDPRRFGSVELVESKDVDEHTKGMDPLNDDSFQSDRFMELIGRSKAPIKNLLLSQDIVAGLGNIYVLEALFEVGILPTRKGSEISYAKLKELRDVIPPLLARAVSGGGSSIRDYVNVNGQSGSFQNAHAVYGREGLECVRCAPESKRKGKPAPKIERIVQAQRSSFFCAHCQF